MQHRKSAIAFLLSAVYFIALYFLVYHTSQYQGDLIVLFFSLAFVPATWLSMSMDERPSWVTYLPILAALLPIFSFPGLSDDVYRFLWDGHLVLDGVDPFHTVPSKLISQLPVEPYAKLYARLNSPHYHSVYPPVSQLVFALAAAAENVAWNGVLIMKLAYATIHLLALGMFYRSPLHQRYPIFYLTYGLNPLVIVEGIGNLHAEVMMVACLIISWVMYQQNKTRWSAVFFALAIGTKLLPLMFLPIIWKWGKAGKTWMTAVIMSLTLIFLPFFLLVFTQGFFESLDLYFRKFEFNAGLYCFLRWLGFVISGYNLIQYLGPLLGLSALVGILQVSWRAPLWIAQGATFAELLLAIVIMYVFSVTTLHPWYLIMPLSVSLLTRFRFVWIWSYLIVWSYTFYDGGLFAEDYSVIWVEYGVVAAVLWWEWQGWKKRRVTLG